ncbi:MAG: hypothetical protein ACI9QL_002289 [Candidatus Omnitrophota bacterium]|jgi:hypothetical protein
MSFRMKSFFSSASAESSLQRVVDAIGCSICACGLMPDSPWATSFWRLKVVAGVMRMSEPVGAKVIHVCDPAVTDCREWVCWKTRGIYVISREK